MHVGTALTMTLQDTLIRTARMRGFETLWLPGTDHASIAVHVLLERQLASAYRHPHWSRESRP